MNRYFHTSRRGISRCLIFGCLLVASLINVTHAQVRIKAIASVEGMRVNQLTGMGLVTGLNGTGGNSPVTRQYSLNMIQSFGLRATPRERQLVAFDMRTRTDNISVVTVTAQLPIVSRPGSHIDVTVSAFDDADSLLGGTLITTPLFGVDGEVYAVASGPVALSGFSFSGDAGSAQKNHPTTGRIPNGGVVEQNLEFDVARTGGFRLLLRHADYETAQRIAAAINAEYPGVAQAEDAGAVRILVPAMFAHDEVAFISGVYAIPVAPDMAARVVINERTGTIVVGEHVRISAVAIAHANLAILTAESPEVSQPAPFSDGVTAVVPRTDINVVEEKRPVVVIGGTTNVGDLAQALNLLGVTPRDLSAIFQQLDAAGALHAELVFQ